MQAPIESLRGLYVFAHVAETASFSRAAERLGVTKSAVSKQIAQLEADLSVQLLVRTTRKLALTEAGARVYEASARIAGDVEAARDAAHRGSSLVAGPLRVTAPAALGGNYLVPIVDEFMRLHPEVTFDLLLSDSYVDLIGERVDIAVRVGGAARAKEQSLVSRQVSRVEFFVVASPAYLKEYGTPRTPADLAQHFFLGHLPTATGTRITLRKGTRNATVQLRVRLSCNDGPTNLEAARRSVGMLAVPDFEAGRDVHEGTLVRVLPGWRIDDAVMHLVFPPRRHVLGRVRAFSDFMAERFREPPWRCRG